MTLRIQSQRVATLFKDERCASLEISSIDICVFSFQTLQVEVDRCNAISRYRHRLLQKGTRTRRDEHLHMHQVKKTEGTGVYDIQNGGGIGDPSVLPMQNAISPRYIEFES